MNSSCIPNLNYEYPKITVYVCVYISMQEWSYIPVGGSLPNTEQKNLAFGAAASMVHPATGMSWSCIRLSIVLSILYSSFLLNRILSSQIFVRGSRICFSNCIYLERGSFMGHSYP